jgi:hypothetical protein
LPIFVPWQWKRHKGNMFSVFSQMV